MGVASQHLLRGSTPLPAHHPAGKTLKCADVIGDMKDRYAESYKTCADKEVLQGSSSSGGSGSSSAGAPSWAQKDNADVAGKDIASGGKAFTQVSADVAGAAGWVLTVLDDLQA